jgi:hypothetical protein
LRALVSFRLSIKGRGLFFVSPVKLLNCLSSAEGDAKESGKGAGALFASFEVCPFL